MKKLKFLLTYPDSRVEELFVSAGYESVTSGPDFLVFPGGADVSPDLYLERMGPFTTSSPSRDLREMGAFLQYYDLPKIGICRGYQFLAVCSGDKLVQHIEGHGNNHDAYYYDIHGHFPNNVDYSCTSFRVTSTHHQCVVAKNMIELFTHDNVSEGGWCPETNSFGVQWHPEYGTCPQKSREFFLSLVKEFLNA